MWVRGLTAVGVPTQPVWLLYVKLAIVVLAAIVLALAAWALSLYNGGYPGGFAGGMDHFIVRRAYVPRLLRPHVNQALPGHPEFCRLRRCGRLGNPGTPVLLPHRRSCRLHPQRYFLARRLGVVCELRLELVRPQRPARQCSRWLRCRRCNGLVSQRLVKRNGGLTKLYLRVLTIIHLGLFIRACTTGTASSLEGAFSQTKASGIPSQQPQQQPFSPNQ